MHFAARLVRYRLSDGIDGSSASPVFSGLGSLKEDLQRKTMVDFWVQKGWFHVVPEAIAERNKGRPGFYEHDGKTIKLTAGSWTKRDTRVEAIKFFVKEILDGDISKATYRAFDSNHLANNLLQKYYFNSHVLALLDAGIIPREEAILHLKPEGLWRNLTRKTNSSFKLSRQNQFP
ncbi:Uncharacterised protein [Candidatus Gugararchaeum adminiculabundum]|nr:Uncharacterised protein [Candidatus Gugararchaeum adminiculabundum]